MSIQFLPISPTDPNNYNVSINDIIVGTFQWQKGMGRPQDKKAIVHSRHGPVAIVPAEKEAIEWFIKKEQEQL